ncbi:hypothetical protein [Arthrobacter sp. A2-55]|uniref:hypothetical protein n=1 Tax=Arthrobacter sp. A2-55 TaxID=2897337 RepID=UPI0021CDAD8B|nr:hypothetical protein [Arthrobacter sp. A2-55]MCU6479018.1 hypothetical protein [Arthrobacter sp. A2-55]
MFGYIVVEFNQASGQPGLTEFGELHGTVEDAREEYDRLLDENRRAGRRERYAIGTVTVDDDGW